ncbi:poly-gamma-glutamate biosynthesis protein [Neobacillus sp. MER 74]|uniref:poly-gamma-glutamate biosynthesis protein n=1 Tax=Neobacillus sp. MER 74 TaxID=2939566 RepID=UPI002041A0FA|nr:poly-gamma-glutamate biosynthesis protein [Neobacillus sp. MER 74]MCM3116043.1 poly-gamma-glutamate biosynthesis protein [Neobacillus sp. MER 74]
MISTRKELRDVLNYERNIYCSNRYSKHDYLRKRILSDPFLQIWKFVKLLRKSEYHYNNRNKNVWHCIWWLFYGREKNKLGTKLGIEIPENTFDKGLLIWHSGNIVVNARVRVGKNCVLHGDNCIGNGGENKSAPILGDNVDVGVGAKIIGDVQLGNNIKIGAGAVVVKTYNSDGVTLIGIPAQVKKQ